MLEVPARFKTVSRTVTSATSLISQRDKPEVNGTLHAHGKDSGLGVSHDVLPQECLGQIDRLSESHALQGSEALRKLLHYLAHHTLNSPADHLKEYQIATEVLGRPSDFDPQSDACVRVQVGRLRTKVTEYYESTGISDPIVVDVPKGRYSLSFERRVVEAEKKDSREPDPAATPPIARLGLWNLAAIGAIALLACCATVLWVQNRNLERKLTPWKYAPATSAFWSGFLESSRSTDVVMEDDAFLLVQNISHESFGFNDYLNRTYISRLQDQKFNPEVHFAQNIIAGKTLARAAEVRLVQRVLALDPAGSNLHVYNAREYMPALLTEDNVILLGNPTADPWSGLFESRLNFSEEANDGLTVSSVTNHAPVAGEQSVYIPTNTVGYCVVAYLPKPEGKGNLILIQGTSSEATEAGGDFLLSEDRLSTLLQQMHATEFPHFEVLLKTSQVTGTPLTTTVEAFRIHPNGQ